MATTKSKTTPNKKNNSTLYLALGSALLVGGVAIAMGSSTPKTKIGEDTFEPNPTPTPTPVSNNGASATGGSSQPTLNKNLMLQKGSKGNEVKELQKLLGIAADGDFGPNTENSLLAKKGVKKITLNTFTSTPNVVAPNPNPYNIGTKLMSNRKPSTSIFNAIQKADGTYYTTNKIETTVDYGEHVGVIVGMTSDKNAYLIDRKNAFGVTYKYFVNASSVKKY